jgi:dTDP-4-dehydrorhamnose 3,5-epimerase
MQGTPLPIPDVVAFERKLFGEDRGFLYKSFNQKIFEQATGLKREFVQDNHSKSQKGGLTGPSSSVAPHGTRQVSQGCCR